MQGNLKSVNFDLETKLSEDVILTLSEYPFITELNLISNQCTSKVFYLIHSECNLIQKKKKI